MPADLKQMLIEYRHADLELAKDLRARAAVLITQAAALIDAARLLERSVDEFTPTQLREVG